MAFVFIWLMFIVSSIAFGQDADISALPDCNQVNEVFMTTPWFGKVTAAVLSGMGGLRLLAELLMRIAPATKYGIAATQVASVIGLFGIGTPKGPKK
jgi:hypothetical protein